MKSTSLCETSHFANEIRNNVATVGPVFALRCRCCWGQSFLQIIVFFLCLLRNTFHVKSGTPQVTMYLFTTYVVQDQHMISQLCPCKMATCAYTMQDARLCNLQHGTRPTKIVFTVEKLRRISHLPLLFIFIQQQKRTILQETQAFCNAPMQAIRGSGRVKCWS